MTDLKTLREVAERAKDLPYTGYVPEDAWHVDPHDPEIVIVYGDYEKHGRAHHGVIDGAFNAAVALHIAAFDPPTVLALLDRIEELKGALTTLQGERDRLRDVAKMAETVIDELSRDSKDDLGSAMRVVARQIRAALKDTPNG